MHQARDLGTKIVSPSATSLLQIAAAIPGSKGEALSTVAAGISVSTVQMENDLVVYKITATVGSHTETQMHSIGLGGTNPAQPPPMSTAELQVWLDEKRQIVADNAAWHAALDVASSEVL